jgi:hypothetical protein
MAKDKKSVLLYCDIIHTVEQLDDADAGLLFKHYLRYINDQNPEPPSKLIKIVFEPIKQNLKRDLKKWEDTLESRSIAGKAGASARWQNMASDGKRIEGMAKIAVKDTVIVNVTDTVNDNVNEKKNINTVAVSTATFEQREKDFMKKLAPFVETYGKEMLREFYNYWTERNDNGKKMRFEMQKVFQHERRLIAWSKNIKQNKHGKQPTASTDAEWHNIASNYIAAKEAGRI